MADIEERCRVVSVDNDWQHQVNNKSSKQEGVSRQRRSPSCFFALQNYDSLMTESISLRRFCRSS